MADADFERRARAALRKPVYPLDAPRAQALLSLYDPARLSLLVPALFALGIVVTIVSSVGPARRAARIAPLAAMRDVATDRRAAGFTRRSRAPGAATSRDGSPSRSQ